jgi:fermentation-respiration switch protein FrsA (DUF1100 family)
MKQPTRRIRSVLKLLIAVAFLFLMLRWFEHSQVYHPDRVLNATGAELGRPFEDVRFTASDGVKLHGWFFPAGTNSPRGHLAILVCHGNGGNISYLLDFTEALLDTGAAVFLFDYRGYGKSEGRPSEHGTYLDAEAAHRWLQQKGFAGANIVAYGESLGGGIASELATRTNVAGLVLQSTFSCIPDIGRELFPWLPVRLLCTIKYDTCSRLPKLHIPVLVMHSRSDSLVRFHHSEKNFSVANEPKLFWELQGDHNDPIFDRAHFISGLEKFFALIESGRPRTSEPIQTGSSTLH